MDLTATTTIRKPASEVYAFWRDLENLPTFMAHLEEVRTTGVRPSHWSAGAPFGRSNWPDGRPSKNSSTSDVFTTSAYLAFMSHRLIAWLACERSKQPSSASEMR